MTGRCPKCESEAGVVVEGIRAHDHGNGTTWPAVLFLCEQCRTILSVSLDPEWQAQVVAVRLKAVGP